VAVETTFTPVDLAALQRDPALVDRIDVRDLPIFFREAWLQPAELRLRRKDEGKAGDGKRSEEAG
jgi:hypothetical protein